MLRQNVSEQQLLLETAQTTSSPLSGSEDTDGRMSFLLSLAVNLEQNQSIALQISSRQNVGS